MLRDKARELRKNLTDAEKLLWSRLRYKQLGYRFRRQVPLDFYIADFVCLEKDSSSSWMAVSTIRLRESSKIVGGHNGSNHKDFAFFDFGTTKLWNRWTQFWK